MMIVIYVCVILHLNRHAFVIISVQYNFFMIYLLTCKACDYLNSLANQLVSLRIPDLDLASEIMPDCWR
jgi:hypothetical protein